MSREKRLKPLAVIKERKSRDAEKKELLAAQNPARAFVANLLTGVREGSDLRMSVARLASFSGTEQAGLQQEVNRAHIRLIEQGRNAVITPGEQGGYSFARISQLKRFRTLLQANPGWDERDASSYTAFWNKTAEPQAAGIFETEASNNLSLVTLANKRREVDQFAFAGTEGRTAALVALDSRAVEITGSAAASNLSLGTLRSTHRDVERFPFSGAKAAALRIVDSRAVELTGFAVGQNSSLATLKSTHRDASTFPFFLKEARDVALKLIDRRAVELTEVAASASQSLATLARSRREVEAFPFTDALSLQSALAIVSARESELRVRV